jgi:tetratricopeptide (TPR) repeat protein
MYISIRDFVAAEPQIADILRADTRNVHALRLRAAMRLEQGRIDDAIADLRQALGDQPRSAEVIALLAIAYERNGSIELAEKQFSDAVRILDYAPAAGLEYVAFLKRRGRNRQAEDVLIELARRHPDNAAILTAWAQIRLAQQNWAGASEIADTIRMLKDQSGVADQILASSLSGQKKYDQSAELLTKVYADNPGALPPMFALVRSYVLDRQIDKAEAFLDAVLSASPANSEARVLKGLVQIAGNAPEQAVKSFEAAIEANPRSPAGYRALAELESSRGNYDQALNVLRAGLREQPGSLPLRLAQAGILELSGNVEAAIEQYEILLKEQPGSLVIANNLASLMSEHRKDQASLDRAYVLAKSLAESPLPQFKDTMGWISHLRGDHRRAIALLEEAVAGLPKDPLVRYHLGMSYVAAGQAERGNAELRTAADLVPPGREALTEKIKTAIVD